VTDDQEYIDMMDEWISKSISFHAIFGYFTIKNGSVIL